MTERGWIRVSLSLWPSTLTKLNWLATTWGVTRSEAARRVIANATPWPVDAEDEAVAEARETEIEAM